MFKIQCQSENIIRVDYQGLTTYADISQAVFELMTRPDYPHSNDLQDFRMADPQISQSDLDELVIQIQRQYPTTAARTRVAILLNQGLQMGIGSVFKAAGTFLPFEIEIFLSEEKALAWLEEGL